MGEELILLLIHENPDDIGDVILETTLPTVLTTLPAPLKTSNFLDLYPSNTYNIYVKLLTRLEHPR